MVLELWLINVLYSKSQKFGHKFLFCFYRLEQYCFKKKICLDFFFCYTISWPMGNFSPMTSSQLLNSNNEGSVDSRHSMVSYGVRSSIAAYLSISEEQERKTRRNKKGWTVYGMPNHSNTEEENTD